MAALVQSFPQQAATVSMMPSGPSSSHGGFQPGPSRQSHSHQSSRSSQLSQTMYGGSIPNMGIYRGQTSQPAVAPYAFTTTPALTNTANLTQAQSTPQLRQENRTSSSPASPHGQWNNQGIANERQLTSSSSKPNLASPMTEGPSRGREMISKDDSTLSTTRRVISPGPRPLSSLNLSSSVPFPPPVGGHSSAKPSPERYRRPIRRPEQTGPAPAVAGGNATQPASASPSGSGMATVGYLYDQSPQSGQQSSQQSAPAPSRLQHSRSSGGLGSTDRAPQVRMTSVDDMQLHRPVAGELAKRYRRRSTSGLEAVDLVQFGDGSSAGGLRQNDLPLPSPARLASLDKTGASGLVRPDAGHSRTASSDSSASIRSGHSRPSSLKRDPGSPQLTPLTSNSASAHPSPEQLHDSRMAGGSSRGHPEVTKRIANPSPLSKPVVISPATSAPHEVRPTQSGSGNAKESAPPAGPAPSSAVQQLADLNDKEAKKGVKSRLRRAFSFGSAAELRRASAQNNLNNASAERARLRKERYQEEREAEQAAIAQKQEEGGIGEGIYSGQGNFFTGSTDNLSISSTASSASIMIRKMGKGMKKSTKNFVGRFRPKSVVGVPAPDGAASQDASVAQVSMVTVEAEREKVNVNVDPHDQRGGGTGYPKLERNSLDAASSQGRQSSSRGESVNNNAWSRKSIIGGDQERAEILATVKRGILKRNGTDSASSSPVVRPTDTKALDFNLPQIPNMTDSPFSTSPSSHAEGGSPQAGHRRTDSVRIEGEDYFVNAPRFGNVHSNSAPETPQNMIKANVTFSPRIQFHDTWPSGEYDRRGEIATCNRLTPILAQQIKEELNTFKMEMDVHESSKVYTHFF